MFPFAPPPVFGAFYQSLAHRKYHLPLRQLLLQRFFSCCFCRCRFFVCGGFFCPAFLSAAAFSAAAFSAAFLSLPLSLLPLSYQLQPFQQPLFCCFFVGSRFLCCRFLLSFCLAFSAASVAAFFLASAAAASPLQLSSSAPPQQPRLFSALRCGFGGFCFCFFLRVCRRFLPASSAALASASAFALASAAASLPPLPLASALTRPVLRLLHLLFLLLSR